MARWAPDTRERLRSAALELFDEQGFGATTVDDVVARAGLTKRTFFRHFSDKREVFFGDDEIPAIARHILAATPAGVPPLTLVSNGLRTLAAERFEPHRDRLRAARRVIVAEPALLERDLKKQADLRDAIDQGFRDRGQDPLTARVLGGLSVEWFQTALEAWIADDSDDSDHRSAPLSEHLDRVLERMRSVLG
ncbi:helix-turn-helix domain-containing protein [Curtobacterium sp. MCPF17_002]|uniref:TetR/AcrR family transcriptional regulator n=1 Tax=Curtobacterium sp. MCPF17_002 TaxID=2175645 RepID=UPI000DA82FED|nr:TetR/AcrR family transcriptional regulator [Curtobacterium sp. MCPF17_002]WIB78349.1 helix-turn-helix domain-containing protein [Curtobacterium sp. MCPF17_002]